jgi:pimeloyl-ACP methyl ester carboxylesterase
MAEERAHVSVYGIDLEVVRCGTGRPLVLLHDLQPVDREAPFLAALARHASVIAPSHPGFGRSSRPKDFDTVYDLVRMYLAFVEQLGFDAVTLMGFGFGGWLAAEIAVVCRHRLDALILVDAVGIKVSGPDTADILDIFNTLPAEVERRRWHDPATWTPDFDAMSDEALVAYARDRDTLCLYAWHPYMHNPQLRRWLPRIAAPTLVVWGASDGIVTPAYGHAYAAGIPGARFEIIERAGHHPEIEQPAAFVERVVTFMEARCRPGT